MRTLPKSLLSLTGGSNAYGRLLSADSVDTGGGDLTAAVDVFHDDGPWLRGDDYQGFKALAGVLRSNQMFIKSDQELKKLDEGTAIRDGAHLT